jgi:serine/threonine-protein kinase
VSTDPRVGTRIGGYLIERLLGRGGMSVVYLAEDVHLKRKAALKLLSPELADDHTFRARFVSEWERLAQLDHPNIIPVFEAGEADGLLFIAMRYVRTTDLKGLIEQEGTLDAARAVGIIAQTASALDAAHEQRLVHRDVKPANILLAIGAGPEGTDHVYLSDFGLTKHTESDSGLTQTGHFMGTIDYVAPEQIAGKTVDGRTDQYALACVLYQCLTGRVPFPREEQTAALFAHLQDPPPRVTEVRPELPAAIDEVIARAMAKEREARYESCTAFARAARQALGVGGAHATSTPPETVVAPAPGPVIAARPAGARPPEPVVAPPPPPTARPPERGPSPEAPSRRGVVVGAIVVVVALAGALVVSRLGGADDDGGGQTASTGPTASGLPVLLRDDFSDASSGWETVDAGGITQGYVAGRYEVAFGESAVPGSFALATGGGTGVGAEDVRISVAVEVLGLGEGKRDGVGVSCRAGGGGAYYFIISSGGGWSIQKLQTGQVNARALATSTPDVPDPAIRRGASANRISAECTGAAGEPVTLTLSVNGTEVASVQDARDPLPPAGVGLAVAGPTDASPSGFHVAFDDLLVEDLAGT